MYVPGCRTETHHHVRQRRQAPAHRDLHVLYILTWHVAHALDQSPFQHPRIERSLTKERRLLQQHGAIPKVDGVKKSRISMLHGPIHQGEAVAEFARRRTRHHSVCALDSPVTVTMPRQQRRTRAARVHHQSRPNACGVRTTDDEAVRLAVAHHLLHSGWMNRHHLQVGAQLFVVEEPVCALQQTFAGPDHPHLWPCHA